MSKHVKKAAAPKKAAQQKKAVLPKKASPPKKALPIKAAPKKKTASKKKAAPQPQPGNLAAPMGMAPIHSLALIAEETVTLKVKITGTEAGNSTIKISLNTVPAQTIHSSGSVTIGNVKSGDIISIDGNSEGDVHIGINVPADPASMDFSPGFLNDEFLIS
jgi:hypothetical protein